MCPAAPAPNQSGWSEKHRHRHTAAAEEAVHQLWQQQPQGRCGSYLRSGLAMAVFTLMSASVSYLPWLIETIPNKAKWTPVEPCFERQVAWQAGATIQTHLGIRCCKNCGAGVQCAHQSCFCNAERLLFHGLAICETPPQQWREHLRVSIGTRAASSAGVPRGWLCDRVHECSKTRQYSTLRDQPTPAHQPPASTRRCLWWRCM